MKSILTFLLFAFSQLFYGQQKPNVILILTDDQGIGDLGCHGNPYIKTPHIDQFYKKSVRFTDFHVSPLCAPTRSAIVTGQYPINNGVWATYKGRDALAQASQTIAAVFQQNGYRTGMFGKWHLGDNYPVRPTDSGFNHVVQHKAGGVGELSDYWGNNYFNDVYFVNNQPKQFQGYCTDVWFQESIKFIEDTKDQPFFIYLPTNAPHSPLYVDQKYSNPYKPMEGKEIYSAEFYGMITNIDENFGKLEAYLKKKKLADNTILIFMTDNGTGNGVSGDLKIGYNMGFRGKKGYKTEGGHRVPFFIRWKDGKIKGGKDLSIPSSHVDIFPTLISLCNLKTEHDLNLDGIDLTPYLYKKKPVVNNRSIFIHHRQDWRPPHDVKQTCIVKGNWRLLNGKELYNVAKDRKQLHNVAKDHPELVAQMLKENALFLQRSKQNPEYAQMPVSIVGTKEQTTTKLTIQHAIGEDKGIWKSEQVAAGLKNTNNTHAIEIAKNGTYQIECRRWPKECPGPILGIPSENPKKWFDYKTIQPEKVRIQIANQMLEKQIMPADEAVVFTVNLEKGKTFLVNDFIQGKQKYGVYYTYITPLK